MYSPQITLESHAPSYDARTYEFHQLFTFRSPLPLDGDRVSRIMKAASDMFTQSLALNGLLDFAWPPDQVGVKSAPDFKSGAIEFTTRASRPRPVILDS